MHLSEASEADFPAVVRLANEAYRGTGAVQSWNHETGIIEGPRLTDATLRADLLATPDAKLLVARESPGASVIGTVWLEPRGANVWYLGLLTIDPKLQNARLGRTLLAGAEDFVRLCRGRQIRMGVLGVRRPLLAWYERRGYAPTGETEAFPYGDARFGTPLRDDLHFVVLAKQL